MWITSKIRFSESIAIVKVRITCPGDQRVLCQSTDLLKLLYTMDWWLYGPWLTSLPFKMVASTKILEYAFYIMRMQKFSFIHIHLNCEVQMREYVWTMLNLIVWPLGQMSDTLLITISLALFYENESKFNAPFLFVEKV